MYCEKCGKGLTDGSCENCGPATGNAEKKDTMVRDAVTYDYKTVEATQKNALEIIDCYEAMGWELAGKHDYVFVVSLNFRRNRKIKNKDQLNRLQVKLDDHINGIGVYEKRKTQNAQIISLIVGIIGVLVFGGGMCLCLLTPLPEIVSYIAGSVLGVIGAAVCGLAYLIYKKLLAKDTVAMNALIDKKRDEISNICEDAQKLFA